MIKALLGFVAFIFLILFIVIMIARGGKSGNNVVRKDIPQLNTAASSDANFQFTQDGPIVAEEDHFSIQISVNKSNRTVRVIRGYKGQVVASSSFGNNEAAFADFLSALDRAGYTNVNRSRYQSEAGLCPLNNRFVFQSDQFEKDFRTWTTSCRENGTFGGNFSTISSLFRDQIPNYNQFISSTRQTTGLSL